MTDHSSWVAAAMVLAVVVATGALMGDMPFWLAAAVVAVTAFLALRNGAHWFTWFKDGHWFYSGILVSAIIVAICVFFSWAALGALVGGLLGYLFERL